MQAEPTKQSTPCLSLSQRTSIAHVTAESKRKTQSLPKQLAQSVFTLVPTQRAPCYCSSATQVKGVIKRTEQSKRWRRLGRTNSFLHTCCCKWRLEVNHTDSRTAMGFSTQSFILHTRSGDLAAQQSAQHLSHSHCMLRGAHTVWVSNGAARKTSCLLSKPGPSQDHHINVRHSAACSLGACWLPLGHSHKAKHAQRIAYWRLSSTQLLR